MKARLRNIIVGLAAIAALAAWPARAETVLKVGDQKGGAKALMEAAGALKDLPYRIEWSEWSAAAPLLEALNAGAIDAGYVGDAPFTFAVAAGVPIKAISAVRTDQGGLAILVQKNSPIHSLAELKGKRVGTGKGSIGHQLVLSALEKAGLPKDYVQLVFLTPADAKAAFSGGQIDAWSTWEPFTAQEELFGNARRLVTGEGITPGLSFQVARNDAIASKHAELEDFVRRHAAARAWALTHIDAYAATWSQIMGIPKEVPTLWFQRQQVRSIPIDANVVSGEQFTIDLYARNGLIGKTLDAKGVVDTGFNAATVKGASQP